MKPNASIASVMKIISGQQLFRGRGKSVHIIGPGCRIMTVLLLLTAGCTTYHPQPLSPQRSVKAFDSRTLKNPGVLHFLRSNHVRVVPSHGVWNLKALTLVAFYYQPTLAEARARLLAAQAAKITAGQRPNPSVSVTPGYDSQIPATPSPWIVPLTFDWPIETAGKRGDRMAVARYQAESARWNLVGDVWRVRSAVRGALLKLYAARQTRLLLTRQEKAQSKVVQMLAGQFSAGMVSSYEVTQARIALDTTILAEQAARGQYRQAQVGLATALGLPVRALDGLKFSFAELKKFPRQLTTPVVRRRALLARADVRGALAQYAASQAALKLQIAHQYPDLHLGPGYSWNSGSAGDSMWELGMTLTLPVLNQNQGPIAEAAAKRKLAAAHFVTVQAAAISQIDSALAGYRSALQQVATARRLLGNLRRSLHSVKAQAQTGEITPLVVADAQVAFDTGMQNQFKALIQAQQALGQLEDATQSPLTLPEAAVHAAELTAGPK